MRRVDHRVRSADLRTPEIKRNRFDDALDQALSRAPLVVLTAPAGAGKTIALRNWSGSHPDVTVIDDGVNVADGVAVREPLDIVVDDLMAERTPAVIAGRAEPAIGLLRRVGRREVSILGFESLLFDADETAELLGHRLPQGIVSAAEILELTGGWPVLVDLIAGEMSGHAPGSAARTCTSLASEYLRAEVVDPLPADLLRTAVSLAPLPDFSLELAAAALLDPALPQRFREFQRRYSWLIALRDPPSWFRAVPLLRQVLGEYRYEVDAIPEPVVLRRASQWCEQMGMWEEAFDLTLRGSPVEIIPQISRMMRKHAHEPAGRAAVALRTIERFSRGLPLQPPVLLGWATSLLQVGLYDEAVHLLARVDPHEWSDADRVVEYFVTMAFAERCRFRHAEASVAADTARSILAGLGRERESAPAESDDHEASIHPIGPVGEEAPRSRRDFLKVRAANQLIDVRLWEGDLAAVRDLAEEVQREVHASGVGVATLRYLTALAVAALDAGDLPAARTRVSETMREAARQECTESHVIADAHVVLGGLALEAGDPTAARSEFARAKDLAVNGQYPTSLARALLGAVECAIVEARYDDAVGLIDALPDQIGAAGASEDATLEHRILAAEVALHAAAGDLRAARSRFDRAMALAMQADSRWRIGLVRAALRYALKYDDVDAVGALVPSLAESGEPRDILATKIARARLLAAGDPNRSAEELRSALGIARRWGLQRTLVDLAGAVRRGLESLTEDSDALTDRRTRRQARDLLAHLSDEQKSLLTDRETAVAVLLPSRMTNQDVAEHLSISANTVKTHIRHIYEKLGVARRIDAVERLVELGLVPRSHHRD